MITVICSRDKQDASGAKSVLYNTCIVETRHFWLSRRINCQLQKEGGKQIAHMRCLSVRGHGKLSFCQVYTKLLLNFLADRSPSL